ncbi:hypothetical protein N8J89_07760 [Crossiella sp. CA-258035]|uniref:hypothetical protein n=1 Tax=Crossiella sp. CA-258035 TaxID=2981138 RepID=UPI0024BD03C0|nr:hypothetical protein [Crossiella sp. CA-258035]WHT20949.1 hypothetical protein N8J89_07760 [Crossiella sp. CA-258035]
MGREIKRVALDFEWPRNKVWGGYLMPDWLSGEQCPDCENGYSAYAQRLHSLWYGYVPFKPADNGSTPLTADTPAVRAFATRNVSSSPDFYGTDTSAVIREAWRLARLWNGQWSHHLNQDDVDALLAADRLWDLTRRVVPGKGWQDIDPTPHPTAAEVNEWSLRSFGHDALNASIVIRARCERDGMPVECARCEGCGSLEAYPGQRAEAEAWERTEPPTGDGWQLWETVSEGSPISPVFVTAEDLARWLTTPESAWGVTRPMSIDQARGFVKAGWSPTFIGDAEGIHDGASFVGSGRMLDGA